jgi:hypothetical protein
VFKRVFTNQHSLRRTYRLGNMHGRGKVGSIDDGPGPRAIWNPFDVANQGNLGVSAHQESSGGAIIAWPQRPECTVRYLGIEVDDALEISEQNGSLIGLDDVCLNGRLGRAFGHFVEYERPNSAAGP